MTALPSYISYVFFPELSSIDASKVRLYLDLSPAWFWPRTRVVLSLRKTRNELLGCGQSLLTSVFSSNKDLGRLD